MIWKSTHFKVGARWNWESMNEKLAHLQTRFLNLSIICKGQTTILRNTCRAFSWIRYTRLLEMLYFENEKEKDFLSKFKKNMIHMQNRYQEMMETLPWIRNSKENYSSLKILTKLRQLTLITLDQEWSLKQCHE